MVSIRLHSNLTANSPCPPPPGPTALWFAIFAAYNFVVFFDGKQTRFDVLGCSPRLSGRRKLVGLAVVRQQFDNIFGTVHCIPQVQPTPHAPHVTCTISQPCWSNASGDLMMTCPRGTISSKKPMRLQAVTLLVACNLGIYFTSLTGLPRLRPGRGAGRLLLCWVCCGVVLDPGLVATEARRVIVPVGARKRRVPGTCVRLDPDSDRVLSGGAAPNAAPNAAPC